MTIKPLGGMIDGWLDKQYEEVTPDNEHNNEIPIPMNMVFRKLFVSCNAIKIGSTSNEEINSTPTIRTDTTINIDVRTIKRLS